MIGDRWGVTRAETARRYPCDDFVSAPALEVWRGVDVHADPEQVWPWIRQISLAPYSYDWIDNLGRQSPRTLSPLPDPVPGGHFTTCGGRELGRVIAVDPTEHLTARIMGAVMSYVLDPGEGTTRLLLKVVMKGGRWAAPMISVGDLVMARRQLLNLKLLAERTASITPSPR